MENKKVYVVTSGEYSDYGIEAIFDNQEEAQKYIDLHRKYNKYCRLNDLEEYELNSISPKVKPVFVVKIDWNGNVICQETDSTEDIDQKDDVCIYEYCKEIRAESIRGFDVALKIARDKLGMIKARKEGLT